MVENSVMLSRLETAFTGTQINYYFHCHRQLWLFSHHLQMEQESDVVSMGKLLHEQSYGRQQKEIEIDRLKLDFFDIQQGVLHEIKKSKSFEHAHVWQTLFYLYQLKQFGVSDIRAEINYPLLRRVETVELTPEKEEQLIRILKQIQTIVEAPNPPKITVKTTVCRKCSYFEYCWIDD